MSKNIQKEIDRLEANLSMQNQFIHQQQALLREFSSQSRLILPGLIIGGLVFGYVFARKKSMKDVIRHGTSFALTANRLYSNLKSFL